MRTSTAYSFETSISTLQKRQNDLTTAQTQLTSGKRVNAASDDPVAAARAERALSAETRAEANQRTVLASRNAMSLSSSALDDSIELLQQAREKMVQAGNGSYSDSDRQTLAVALKEIRNQLLSVANRTDSAGGFVFGGQGSSSPPFIDTPSGVQFVGQGGESMASTSDNMGLTLDGDLAWLKAKTGNGVFETAAAPANSGSGWITSGAITGPGSVPYPAASGTTPPAYSVQFSVAGGVTSYSVLENGTAMAGPQPYTPGTAIAIPGRGMSVTVSGSPANGDQFSIGQSSNTLSVFDTLDQAIAGLKTPGANTGQTQQTVNSTLTRLDSVLGNLGAARSAVGETLNRIDNVEMRNESLKIAAKAERSAAEDLDMVAAISSFQNKQTGYDAALKSYSLVQKLSLFNYVNV